jgi:hypothetical protein
MNLKNDRMLKNNKLLVPNYLKDTGKDKHETMEVGVARINALSIELDIARDTVERGYKHLKKYRSY